MYLSILNDDGSIHRHKIVKDAFIDKSLDGKVGHIGNKSKELNALSIYKAYFSNAKAILLDETNKVILEEVQSLGIVEFGDSSSKSTCFDSQDFSLTYFTSGSTGYPIAALKSKDNLELEVETVSVLLQKYNIKKVVVTVPFVHLYGTLFGLMYPLLNNIDIVIKEHFLPHDLLDIIDADTLVITTPMYIAALNKLQTEKDLSKSVFISSTAPLDTVTSSAFKDKFKADIIQIFGSTETGGIAYKTNGDALWRPLDGVEISSNEKGELKVRSPFVSKTLYEKGFSSTQGEVQTCDYIEEKKDSFQLIGRSSKILKVAGKRYSTIQIENLLEEENKITKALVFVELDEDTLRGEYLDITLESKYVFSTTEINKILRENISSIKFKIKLSIVECIPMNKIGKKLRIR